MYAKFFNFRDEPFNITPDPKYIYFSNQYKEALESLLYGITSRKGFMALTGDIGTGKTTLCRELLNRLDKNVDTSIIFNPMLTVIELLEAINDDFGNREAGERTVKSQIDILNKFLIRRLRYKKNAVVIIDEAQHLSFEAFEMLRMLSNLETENQKLIQIVFIGQPELDEKLGMQELRQLNQRIGIRYRLGHLNFRETVEYVIHRLSVAGGEGFIQFDHGALKAIYDNSEGIPRLINIICDRALLESYAEENRLITKRAVKKAVDDITCDKYGDVNSVNRERPWLLRWIGLG